MLETKGETALNKPLNVKKKKSNNTANSAVLTLCLMTPKSSSLSPF